MGFFHGDYMLITEVQYICFTEASLDQTIPHLFKANCRSKCITQTANHYSSDLKTITSLYDIIKYQYLLRGQHERCLSF